jgi:hypothetical protein
MAMNADPPSRHGEAAPSTRFSGCSGNIPQSAERSDSLNVILRPAGPKNPHDGPGDGEDGEQITRPDVPLEAIGYAWSGRILRPAPSAGL